MWLYELKTKKDNIIKIYGYDKRLCAIPEIQEKDRSHLLEELGHTKERTLPNSSYNCHGLTFIGKTGHIGSGTIEQKLSLPGDDDYAEFGCDEDLAQIDIETILKDNGFSMKANVPNLDVDKFYTYQKITGGDIVVYRDYKNGKKFISHSGVVFNVRKSNIGNTVDIMVLSKISVDQSEFFHSIKHKYIIKAYGKCCEVWSDSK